MTRLTYRLGSVLLMLLAIAGCTDRFTPTGPPPSDQALRDLNAGARDGLSATVLTRNVYVGTDVASLLSLDLSNPTLFVQAVSIAHGEVIQSLPAERMRRIADEIAAGQPDLVALQEVAKLMVQIPGDFLQVNSQAASVVQFDYLQLLPDGLAERSRPYRVAAVVENADVELPAFNPQISMPYDVRMVDRDVILVREGVPYWNSDADNYAAFLPVAIGSVQFALRRGWTSVDVRVHGRDLRFMNTHLETQAAAVINELQAQELLGLAAQSSLPVILAGDFNSAANASAPLHRKTGAYATILAAGFMDAWTAARPNEEGLTCCHPDDLLGTQAFDQRIDLVFFGGGFFGAAGAALLGDESVDRTPSGLWPSDHAGVTAQVRLKWTGRPN